MEGKNFAGRSLVFILLLLLPLICNSCRYSATRGPNPEHVNLILNGKQSLEKWRKENPSIELKLSRADFSNIDQAGEYKGSIDLGGMDLRGADLSYSNCTEANFIGTNLGGANLKGAELCGAGLLGTVLEGATLEDIDFTAAYFSGEVFEFAKLVNVNLTRAVAWNTSFKNSSMSKVVFVAADLRGADFSGANFGSANLAGAKLLGANFTGANISNVEGLTEISKILYSSWSENTKWPSGFREQMIKLSLPKTQTEEQLFTKSQLTVLLLCSQY